MAITYVYGVKGTNATIETLRRFAVDVSSDDVLSIWNKLRQSGLAMPSWKDGPDTRIGQEWEWLCYTDATGRRVFPRRREEYHRIGDTLVAPVKIVFGDASGQVERQCECVVKSDSERWRAIKTVFAAYSDAKSNAPLFEEKVSILNTEGDDQPCRDVTLKQLRTHPQEYHGKRVRVTGYRHTGAESIVLSASQEGNDKDALLLGGISDFAMLDDVVPHKDGWVTVEGVFIVDDDGFRAIDRVTRNQLTAGSRLVAP